MRSLEGIKSSQQKGDEALAISRKLFLSYKTEVFRDNEEDEFYIKNMISQEFTIPFSTIQVCGSGKTGLSFFKDKVFAPGQSDLDVAVISLALYNVFLEEAFLVTNGYSDLTKFPNYRGVRTDNQFLNNIKIGYLNPFIMPDCVIKEKWLNFFRRLSNNYYKQFKSINGGIYASETFFEHKQKECILKYLDNPEKYDKISSSFERAN